MKVCFDTFGCRLNKAEALAMEADYVAKGWKVTDSHANANLFVVRGCSVTARAQRDCEHLIAHLRHHYPNTPIRIFGCLKRGTKAAPFGDGEFVVPTRTAKAYLKVQDGCSGKCTFCIVPKFRGASVSIPFDEAVDRAKRFVDAGYHEIDVTGCNLSLYASDGKRLPELVAALAEVSPDCRVRLSSLEPSACAREVVAAMAEHANVCRFLHVPVQSGSDRILKSMQRPYSARDVEELVAEATRRMPNLGLGCDLMTGFPDETLDDFLATEDLLGRLPFNLAHIFPYSERPGTLAVSLAGTVPKEERSARAHQLARVIGEKRLKYARQFIGMNVEIVVEGKTKTEGWTGEYLRCTSVMPATRKSRTLVRVTNVTDDATLEGRVVR